MPDGYLSIKDLAAYSGVSGHLIRHWIKEEGLPVHRPSKHLGSRGARVTVDVREFDEWMQERRRSLRDLELGVSEKARRFVEELLAQP